MKLKLLRLGKSYCKGPLNDHGLLETPWQIGEERVVDDTMAHALMAKYPTLFRMVKSEDKVFDKVGKKPKNKVYEDKLDRPKGIK